jgi:hypothetical protein
VRTSTIIKLLALPVAVVVAACGRKDSGPEALTADLQRDLQLASANLDLATRPATAITSALESTPTSAPLPSLRTKPKPGPKAIRSEAPTVAAAPEPTLAATSEELQVAETPSASPAESETPSPAVGVALPRPVPVPVSMPSAGGTGPAVIVSDGGRDTRGSGGGIIGVVVRGGGGMDDDCEIHDRRRGRGGRPVYVPNQGGMGGGIGVGRRVPVIGTGTFPGGVRIGR